MGFDNYPQGLLDPSLYDTGMSPLTQGLLGASAALMMGSGRPDPWQAVGMGVQGYLNGKQQAHMMQMRQAGVELAKEAQNRQDALAAQHLELERAKFNQATAADQQAQQLMQSFFPGTHGPATPAPVQPPVSGAPLTPQSGQGPSVNNPGNIRPASGQGFNSYPSLQAGAEAMSDLLSRYGSKYGVNTLLGLTSKWAPAGDGNNNPTAYANYLSKQIGGYPIDAPIDLTNPDFRAKIMTPMASFEKGRTDALPPEVARAAALRNAPQLAQNGTTTASDASGLPPIPASAPRIAPAQGGYVPLSSDQLNAVAQLSVLGPRGKQMADAIIATDKARREASDYESLDAKDARKAKQEVTSAQIQAAYRPKAYQEKDGGVFDPETGTWFVPKPDQNKLEEQSRHFRDRFSAESKPYIDSKAAFSKIITAAKDPSAAGDLGLIYGYMRMLDPTSVVREREFATAQNAAGIPERVRNLFNRAVSGERLTPEQRSDFAKQSRDIFMRERAAHDQRVSEYTRQAKLFGLPTESVIQDYSGDIDALMKDKSIQSIFQTGGGSGERQPGAPQAPYPDGTRVRGQDGKTYVVRGGVPVAE